MESSQIILPMLKAMWQIYTLPPFLMFFAFMIVLTYLKIWLRKKRKEKGPTLEERIDKVSESLKSSISDIKELSEDVERKQKAINTLKKEHNKYEHLTQLKTEEAQAVAELLQSDNRKSFWKSAVLNLVFFVLGTIMTLLLK